MEDPYDILGISRGASEDEVKRAYKKLAIKNHPDKGGDPEAFKRIQGAYDRITKPDQNQQQQGFPQGFNPFDMFKQMFQTQKNLHDVRLNIQQAYDGHTLRFKVSNQVNCKKCVCGMCSGTGFVAVSVFRQPCPQCRGLKSMGCAVCSNKGFNETDEMYTVNVPAGTPSGQIVQVCESFDLRVTIEESEIFQVRGHDLIYNVTISFKESLVGTTLHIPHPGGLFEYKTKFIKPTKKYLVKRKGISKQGDLIINFTITYPDEFTDEQIDSLSKIL
jgi:DnaJ family protein A protein 2